MALMIRGMGRLYGGEPVPAVTAFADVRRTIDGSGQIWFRSFEMTYSAMASAQQGNLAAAAGLSVAALKEMGDSPVEIWAQPALRQLGDIFLEWSRLEDARHSFMRALQLAERSGTLHWQSRIRFGLARTLWALGEQEAAFTELDRARDTADVLGVAQDALNARAWQARFWLKSGQLLRARDWADSSALLQEQSLTYGRQVEYLTLARLLIREERPDVAMPILQRLDDLATGAGRTGDQVEIAVVTALAHVASGADADAHRSLDRALELGQPGGYRQVFINERAVLRPLLANAAERGVRRDYAIRLLADIEASEART
jgi:LuxR family maltose regulon positive regulatory protein